MPRLTTLRPAVQTLQAGPAAAPKIAQAFYLTKTWRKAREMALALGAHRCAHCARRGCTLFVDHKVELSDGGAAYDQANLEPLCGACHTTKTVRARTSRQLASSGR